MIRGQRLGQPAGDRNDVDQGCRRDAIIGGHDHGWSQLPNTIGISHVHPDDPTELHRPRHASPSWVLKTVWARPRQTTAAAAGTSQGGVCPINPGGQPLGFLLGHHLLQQFQVFHRNHRDCRRHYGVQ